MTRRKTPATASTFHNVKLAVTQASLTRPIMNVVTLKLCQDLVSTEAIFSCEPVASVILTKYSVWS